MTEMPMQSEPLEIPGRPFGRMVRSVSGYALLMALMFLTPLVVFLPAALFLCGIRNGRRATWLALAAGAVVGIGIGAAAANHPGATSGDVRLTYAYLAFEVLALALPAMLVFPLLERGASFGKVLVAALLIAVPGLGVTEFGSRALLGVSPYADQVAQFELVKTQVIANYQRTSGVPAEAIDAVRRGFDAGSKFVPSVPVISVIVFFILSILMYGRLRAWREYVRTREVSGSAGIYLFRNFSLPEYLLFAFVVSGLAPLATGMLQKVASNVLVVVLFLYLLQGLAIFRSLLAAIGVNGLGLLFAFLLLGFLTFTAGIAPILLTIAGLFDSFFDFRKFRRKDDSNESHTD
jgi:hypothetical protein